MLKHTTSGGGSTKTTEQIQPQQPQETSTSLKLPQVKQRKIYAVLNFLFFQRFVVKYLGFRETSNLWGIRV
jgi:hypothetical protein